MYVVPMFVFRPVMFGYLMTSTVGVPNEFAYKNGRSILFNAVY